MLFLTKKPNSLKEVADIIMYYKKYSNKLNYQLSDKNSLKLLKNYQAKSEEHGL